MIRIYKPHNPFLVLAKLGEPPGRFLGGLEAIGEVVCVIADLLNHPGGMMSGRQLGLQLLYLQRLPLLCVQV